MKLFMYMYGTENLHGILTREVMGGRKRSEYISLRSCPRDCWTGVIFNL